MAWQVSPDSPLGVFLSITPPLSAILCFVLPGFTVKEMRAMGTTGGGPILPYLSMMVQSVLWLSYGVLLHDKTIMTPNLVGTILGTLYVIAFVQLQETGGATGQAIEKQVSLAIVIVGVMTATVFSAELDTARDLLGLVAASGSVFFAFSPLAALATVLRTKSTTTMPLKTSLILFTNSTLWFMYGTLVAPNPAVAIPNGLGTIGGVLQLCVHAAFWNSR